MKILYAVALLFCLNQAAGQKTATLTLTNPLEIERPNEATVLTRSFLESKLGKIPAGKYVQFSRDSRPVLVQYDDLNDDGKWDEIFLLQNFKASETFKFNVYIADAPATIKAVVRAHVRQRHKLPDETFGDAVTKDTMPFNNPPTDFSKQKLPPYLTEGPAWENDKVGFRKYFDTRNANDIWGKVTSRMVLEEVGADTKTSYHNFNPEWGMDILKVGASLGAGALALKINDTLVRFGKNVKLTTYEQVADGPLRAIFRIRYHGWKIGKLKPFDVTEEISIWGGQFFFQNKVTVSGAPEHAELVTGLNDFYVNEAGVLRSRSRKILFTYGLQSENKDSLGMAVISRVHWAGKRSDAPATEADALRISRVGPSDEKVEKAPDSGSDVMNMFLTRMNVQNKIPVTCRFYSAWEKSDDRFKTKAGFVKYLQEEALKMSWPLTRNWAL